VFYFGLLYENLFNTILVEPAELSYDSKEIKEIKNRVMCYIL
jgi:hypothetical protein